MAANKKLLMLPAFSHGLDPKATFDKLKRYPISSDRRF